MAVARPNGADHALLYVPGRSFLHRLNPLTKLALVLWCAVAAFALPPQGTIPLALLAIAVGIFAGAGKVFARRLIFTLTPLALALFVVHGMLVDHEGARAAVLGLDLSHDGLAYMVRILGRIAALLSGSLLFVCTTHPARLLKALDSHNFPPGMAYVIASPLLLLEPFTQRARAIREAQMARGLDLQGSFITRARAFPALLMPAILLYGIYGGVTTPTEAAAVAAFYALILAAVFYRALSLGAFYHILVESARSSAAVGLVIGGALILNFIVASENIPSMMAAAMVDLNISPLAFLLGVNLLILLLGCVLDATTIILVILPLFIPTCRELGIDLVHFGVVAVVNCMVGLITPPYGILLFVINAVTRIPLAEIIREVLPFLAVLVMALLVLILVPDLVLFLPRMLGYQG